MMSALGGREGLPQEQERVLISCVSVKMTRGEGVQKFLLTSLFVFALGWRRRTSIISVDSR